MNSTNYTTEEWKKAIDEYSRICDRLNKMDFNNEEIVEIEKIKGEIAGYAAKSASQQIFDAVKSISEEVSAFTNGFGNTFEDLFRKENQ